jgi:hypothetical protein
MRLPRMSDRFVLSGNEPDVELPPEVEVRNARGERLGRYTLTEVAGTCARGAARPCGVAVDDAPEELVVEAAELPRRFSLALENAGPCARHGWDCPHWVRTAVYARN